MPKTPGTIIQIAGIHDEQEARLLLSGGVDEIGIPLELDFHTPDISIADAGKLCRSIIPLGQSVLITYLDTAAALVSLVDSVGVEKVQIHGDIAIGELQKLRKSRPQLSITKSLIVKGKNGLVDYALALEPFVDRFITDTYDPQSGATGATGKTHDWAISRLLVQTLKRPLILAGGLTPDNVTESIRVVRPAGVDAHTGVEGLDGRKSFELVRNFVAAARSAFQNVSNMASSTHR